MSMRPTPCLAAGLPPEILLDILSLAADEFDPKDEPSLKTGPAFLRKGPNPWCKDLRVMKSVVHVCKRWRSAALHVLYHRVAIFRSGALQSLAEILEDSEKAAKQRGGGCSGYGRWVRHLHGHVYVEGEWETEYYSIIAKILKLCSSLVTMSWKPIWVDRRTLPVTTLALSVPFRPNLHSLHRLSIDLYQDEASAIIPFDPHLPNLEEFVCTIRASSAIERLGRISSGFLLPKLRSLAVEFKGFGDGLSVQNAESLLDVLGQHGQSLTSLVLDTTIAMEKKTSTSFWNILSVTPNLTHIRFSPRNFPSGSPPDGVQPQCLRKMELFAFIPQPYLERPNITLLKTSLRRVFKIPNFRTMFPVLESITIHNDFRRYLWHFSRQERDNIFEFFLSWSRKLGESGITLLDGSGNPMVSADEEQRNGWKTY